MYGIYANIWGIWMVNVTIYSIHGSYGFGASTTIVKYLHAVHWNCTNCTRKYVSQDLNL